MYQSLLYERSMLRVRVVPICGFGASVVLVRCGSSSPSFLEDIVLVALVVRGHLQLVVIVVVIVPWWHS